MNEKFDGLIDTFANRLKKAMQIRDIKAIELSERTGISKSSLSEYISGKYEAKQNGIYLLSKALNVSEGWLMGLDVPMERELSNIQGIDKKLDTNISSNMYPLPLYGNISAGLPNWAEECLEGYLPIAPELMGIVNPEEYFFLKVNGESMNKIVKNGAYALIHKQDYIENGEIAVVLVNGYDATIKKFRKENDVIILYPESDDNSFFPQMYSKNTPIKIIGKYTGKLEINN